MGDADSSVPAPFVFSPSQSWDGNDGSWSTFIIRVGTPEQDFKILPSIQSSETFIPLPEGCIESDPSNCADLRGVYPFNGKQIGFQMNSSSTWKDIGLFNLIIGADLGYEGNGYFGFETVGLMLQNSGGLTLPSQVVAGIATKSFYLGIFGLGPKPANFTNFDYPQPSFMQTLKDENKIPSLSYAYTAGAAYRIPKLTGSLTLGGYDSSRFTANDQTFPFNADDSKPLSLGVQRITARNTLEGSVSALDTTIYSVIDSTFPHIWLPLSACRVFEEAFGLTYDEDTELYRVNDTIRERLRELQPSVTFSLGNDNNPANTVTIEIPYSAFDLQASHPFYSNATNYFPIRRADNDTQYTLGRTFLQEAYVIADYERKNFSVHQALFKSSMPESQIISIPALSNTTNDNNNNNNTDTTTPATAGNGGLSTGAKAGIGAGIGALAVILALLLFFFLRRRRAAKAAEAARVDTIVPGRVEAEAKDRYEMFASPEEVNGSAIKHAWELEHDVKQMALMSDDAARQSQRYEMDANGNKISEMPTPASEDIRYELPGDSRKPEQTWSPEAQDPRIERGVPSRWEEVRPG